MENDEETKLHKAEEIMGVMYRLLPWSVSHVYVEEIADILLPDVIEDVNASADPEDWNDDDVRLACGRVLLGILRKRNQK